MTRGFSVLEHDHLMIAIKGEAIDRDRFGLVAPDDAEAAQLGEYFVSLVEHTLGGGALVAAVGVHQPPEWEPVLVRAEIRWIDVGFDSVDELFDAMLLAHQDDVYAAEVSRLTLPCGDAVRVATVQLGDSDDHLIESVAIHVPLPDATLTLLATCTDIGWAATWGSWLEWLALSVRWEVTLADDRAMLRYAGLPA